MNGKRYPPGTMERIHVRPEDRAAHEAAWARTQAAIQRGKAEAAELARICGEEPPKDGPPPPGG